MRMNFPLQFSVTDLYAYELWEIYQMIFEQRYGKFEGMNHSGTREEFFGRTER